MSKQPYVWLAPADKFLRRYYPTHGARFIAEWLGIEPRQAYYRAQRIKIHTSVPRGKPFQRGHDQRRHDLKAGK